MILIPSACRSDESPPRTNSRSAVACGDGGLARADDTRPHENVTFHDDFTGFKALGFLFTWAFVLLAGFFWLVVALS
jgi:hypothetical protein